jgi:hypothetical protein
VTQRDDEHEPPVRPGARQPAMQVAARQAAAPEHTLELERVRGGAVLIRLAVRATGLDELLTSATTAFDGLCEQYPLEPAPAPAGGDDEAQR